MRLIVVTIVAAALAYALYWFGAARVARAQIAQTITATDGLSVGDWSLNGFPYRFQWDATNVALKDTNGRSGWQGERVAITALSYRPNHLIATLPPVQILRLWGIDMPLENRAARASLILRPGTSLDVQRANLAIDNAALTILGSTHRADTLRAALRAQPDGVDLALEGIAITLDPPLIRLLDPAGQLPPLMAQAGFDATLTLDRPLALRGPSPRVDGITLRRIVLDWGAISIAGDGVLTPDGPETWGGSVNLRIEGWPVLLDILRQTEAISPDMFGMAQTMLANMADPATGRLNLPLSVRASQIFLGPFPIGALPRL